MQLNVFTLLLEQAQKSIDELVLADALVTDKQQVPVPAFKVFGQLLQDLSVPGNVKEDDIGHQRRVLRVLPLQRHVAKCHPSPQTTLPMVHGDPGYSCLAHPHFVLLLDANGRDLTLHMSNQATKRVTQCGRQEGRQQGSCHHLVKVTWVRRKSAGEANQVPQGQLQAAALVFGRRRHLAELAREAGQGVEHSHWCVWQEVSEKRALVPRGLQLVKRKEPSCFWLQPVVLDLRMRRLIAVGRALVLPCTF